MLKLSIVTTLLSTNLFASNDINDKKILSYEKHRVAQNPQVQLKEIKIAFTKELEDGWKGYVFSLDLNYNGKDIKTNDILFSNGKFVTSELKKPTGLDLKRTLHPDLDSRYYDKKLLIAGNSDAKHKIVVFSDPLCPNCTSLMPELIKDVEAHPKKLALYYVVMPLDRLHPTARTLAKAAKIAKEQGIQDVDYKVYSAGFEKYFDPYEEKDNQKALDAFNKVVKTNITLAQVNSPKINEELEKSIKLSDDAMIQGTPTMFFDGEVDLTRTKYKEVIK
jgi:protein-disulfide isomerase